MKTDIPRVLAYLDLERQVEAADGHPDPDLVDRMNAAWKVLTPAEVRAVRARNPGHGNSFEEAARGRKILKLLAKVPVGASREANRITAEWLVGFSPDERALFAQMAGCKSPSSETWRQLVEAVRSRRSVDEAIEDVDGVGDPSEYDR